MNNTKDITSVLQLLNLAYDNIEFHRIGTGGEGSPKLRFRVGIAELTDQRYRVILRCNVDKENEYRISIDLAGIFELSNSEEMDEDLKRNLITKNTVAIMMPYLRSELTLLTAQPGLEGIILPVFNINKIVDEEN